MASKLLAVLGLVGTSVDALSLLNAVEHADGVHKLSIKTDAKPAAWNHEVLNKNIADMPVIVTGDLPYNDWHMCDQNGEQIKSKNAHSNLGGDGPKKGIEQSLRFVKVGTGYTADGKKIKYDLVVTADSPYEPNENKLNGVGMGGCFGVINLKTGDTTDFLFGFYESGTNNSIVLSKFFFTVFDLDTNRDVSGGKTVNESVVIHRQADEVYYEPSRAFSVKGDVKSKEGLNCTATTQGTGSDNPKDPAKLTQKQKERTVMAEYTMKSMFKITFSLPAVGKDDGGRNFAFSSVTNMGPVDPDAKEAPPAKSLPTPLPTAAPTTTTTSCTTSSCLVFADPHVSGFDNSDNQGPAYLALIDGAGSGEQMRSRVHTFDKRPMDVNALETGDFWLVKSDDVHIQARFRLSGEFIPDRAAVGAVAVGGPFLNGHKLLVEPADGTVSIDGVELLDGKFTHREGFSVSQNSEIGEVRAELPAQVTLTFKRLPKHIDVKITMPPPENGLDGECGNYDGIPENDAEKDIEGRMGSVLVSEGERMFATQFDDGQTLTFRRSIAQLLKSFAR